MDSFAYYKQGVIQGAPPVPQTYLLKISHDKLTSLKSTPIMQFSTQLDFIKASVTTIKM